jgi:hypothetical protein
MRQESKRCGQTVAQAENLPKALKYSIVTFLNMKHFTLFCFCFTILGVLQAQTEAQIAFPLDTDTDGIINVLDTDDDNDGVLDNLDFKPLLAGQSSPGTSDVAVTTSADAGLRGNAAGTNYGSDAIAQTRNDQRNLLLKFDLPTSANLNTATLKVFTKTENDPLEVHFLPNSSWTETGVTFTNLNRTGQQRLGATGAPTTDIYTFLLPNSVIPATGGDISLLIYDQLDPTGSGTIEELYTKETAGKAAMITLSLFETQMSKLLVNQTTSTRIYQNDGPFQIGFSLPQAPTDIVYIPFAISDPTVGGFVSTQVLTFTPANWNIAQNLAVSSLKPGSFDLQIKPLHSNDPFYNGHNQDDLLAYIVQTAKITNLSPSTIATGSTLSVDLDVVSAVGSTTFDFKITQGPSGLNIVEQTGVLKFTPLSNQIGTHPVTIEVTDNAGNVSIFQTTITVTNSGLPDPVGLIVDLNAADDPAANGTAAHPYNDIAVAVAAAAPTGIDVLLRGGEFTLDDIVVINSAAPAANPVVIKPLAGDHVKFNFALMNAFIFSETSRYIELEGMEIDGGTDEVDFWCIVAQAFWGDESVPRGGGIAVNIDGQYIKVRNNYIHDTYQKAIEIRSGRYVVAEGNIIHHIATTSLSGGHGIMRQQKGNEFFDDDLPGVYRWDINGNLIFNVEQRIFSWVPSKGFIDMVLDEGKPILIDDPQDTDGIQEKMSARIKDNIVAFGAIDHIRIKSTPNLEVSNNSVFSAHPDADGITSKAGDTATPKFVEFIGKDNIAQNFAGKFSFDLATAIQEALDAPGDPIISGNVGAAGSVIKPNTEPGIVLNSSNQLFIDAPNGNFRINPALGLPATLGADPLKIAALEARAASFGVNIKWDAWESDILTLTQTILDNIPGINDGVTGNETVFAAYGTMTADHHELHFDVVNGAWKTATGSTGKQEFHLNEKYYTWYAALEAAHKNASGQNYENIRYGSSFLKQNQVFDNDWLMVSKISPDTNTVISGKGKNVTLDGDLLIQFDGVTPTNGTFYDLIVAKTITTKSAPNLFDRILFEGATPTNYTLSVVQRPDGQQALRLFLGPTANCNPCGQATILKN